MPTDDGTPRANKTGRTDSLGRQISVSGPQNSPPPSDLKPPELATFLPFDLVDLYEIDQGLVSARRALLDAVELLGAQTAALVLVGAQAVYERTGYEPEEGAPPATNDADFAVDPHLLAASPVIGTALLDAGYRLTPDRPGVWKSPAGIGLDLLVPDAVAGAGSRAARLAIDQGKNAVGRAQGLELALFDNDEMAVGSLDSDDPRSCNLRVAGHAALLCAKWTKLGERIAKEAQRPDRVLPKDAVEVWRLMNSAEPGHVRDVFVRALDDDRFRLAAQRSLTFASEHFGTPTSRGCHLIASGTGKGATSADARRLGNAASDWVQAFLAAF